ncbi:FecR family protein [soil metagenome]
MGTEVKNWEAIAKYLKGELSEDERHELFNWVNAHSDHKTLFEQVKNLWITADQEEEIHVDVESNWIRFKSSIGEEKSNDIPLHEEPARKIKPLYQTLLFRVAAVLVLGFLLNYVVRQYLHEEELIMWQTAGRETKELYLPDSSRVFLNQNSKITYASTFDLENRVVNLEGEAFFEVLKAEGHRFIVYTKNSKTEVLGTSFSVTAYPEQPEVEVKVLTGKVAFSLQDESNTIFLEPGSKGVLATETSEIQEAKIEDPNFLSFKTQQLIFNDTSFDLVISTLESHFGETIQVQSPEVLSCNYSGSFDKPEIEKVLEVLSATMNLEYERVQGKYVITGPGCK